MLRCDKCKEKINYNVIRRDGYPSGISFEVKSGKVITLCAECLKVLGKTNKQEAREYAEELGIRESEGE